MTAVTLAPHPGPGRAQAGGKIFGYNIAPCAGAVVLLFSYRFSSNGFVVREPHSGRKQSCLSFTTLLGANLF